MGIMVRSVLDLRGEMLYVCKACGFAYGDRKWAEKCEGFCTKYNACSIEIAGHAVKSTRNEGPDRVDYKLFLMSKLPSEVQDRCGE